MKAAHLVFLAVSEKTMLQMLKGLSCLPELPGPSHKWTAVLQAWDFSEPGLGKFN